MYRLDTSRRKYRSEITTRHRGGQEEAVRSSRSTVLETAILGLLNSAPLHGYELRKQLSELLGPFRAFSYGTLYPALRSLQERGLLDSHEATVPVKTTKSVRLTTSGDTARSSGRRSRIVYELTDSGREYLQAVLASSGPAAWEDENFDVRFALFSQTDAETRLRILEGRRSRLTERLEAARQSAARTNQQLDEYTFELQRHGLEKVEREVRWLDDLITQERGRTERPSTTHKERG